MSPQSGKCHAMCPGCPVQFSDDLAAAPPTARTPDGAFVSRSPSEMTGDPSNDPAGHSVSGALGADDRRVTAPRRRGLIKQIAAGLEPPHGYWCRAIETPVRRTNSGHCGRL